MIYGMVVDGGMCQNFFEMMPEIKVEYFLHIPKKILCEIRSSKRQSVLHVYKSSFLYPVIVGQFQHLVNL